MAVCYDLRFPELFRIMAVRGARVLAARRVHVATGARHWEMLLRARAIENQAFVIAAGQIGEHPPAPRELRPLDDRRPVGHGARAAPDERGLVVADLDLDAQDAIRAQAARRSPTAARRPTLAEPRRWRSRQPDGAKAASRSTSGA